MRLLIQTTAVSCLLLLSGCRNTSPQTKAVSETNDTTKAKITDPELKSANINLKLDPNNADNYLKRGRIYFKLNNFTAAGFDAERAIRLDSLKDDYYELLAESYFSGNETKKSKEALLRWMKNIPGSTGGFLKMAELCFYMKRYQECINHINAALKIDETVPKGYFLKGMCFKETGDTNPAISSFQTACELNGKYYDALVEAGRLLSIRKNPLCITYFTNALLVKPKSPEVMYMAGYFYQKTGKIKQAQEAYLKLLESDPNNENALYNLGSIAYNEQKEPETAKNYFSRAIEADPKYAEAYLARGICFEKLNRPSEAEADYKMALEFKPNFDFAVENLNKLLNKQKKQIHS